MEIFIFKTNVNSTEIANKVNQFLLSIHEIKRFSFDLEDCDRILRIEANSISSNEIIEQLKNINIEAEELPDKIEVAITDQ